MNLQNLVSYCNLNDLESPFSGVVVPSPLNRETLISAIMIRCGLLTPVYNDPNTFRNATKYWFDAKQWTFEHLIKVIQANYSPIENVDRYDEQTTTKGSQETKTGGFTDTGSATDTISESGTEQLDHDESKDYSGTDTTTNTVSAFNADTFQNDSKIDLAHGESIDTDSTDVTTYGKRTDSTKSNSLTRSNNETTSISGNDVFTQHMHGNIGVTTNQQLINQELELLAKFDVYKYIAEQFENDNMIMLY